MVRIIFIVTLQIKKLRHSEVEQHGWGHIVSGGVDIETKLQPFPEQELPRGHRDAVERHVKS
jgi:hypothetical protein